MIYNAAAQTVDTGESIALPTSVINSTGDITASGTDGLTLAAGQYLVSFSTDAAGTAAGTLGAVLALDGAALPYGNMSIEVTGAAEERLAATVIVTAAEGQTLTVLNNTGDAIAYDNSVLTVVKLA